MSVDVAVRQLLVWRDDRNRQVWVYDHGEDLDGAHDAYCAAEEAIARMDGNRGLEVCLFGAESVDALRITHGSWFPDGYGVTVLFAKRGVAS